VTEDVSQPARKLVIFLIN